MQRSKSISKCSNCQNEILNSDVFCPKCGTKIQAESKSVCSKCGTKIQAESKSVCSKCGVENESENVFCSSCGTKMDETAIGVQEYNTVKDEYTLIISRKSQFFVVNPAIKIVLDDTRIFSIKNGDYVECQAGSGRHRITIKGPFGRTTTAVLEIGCDAKLIVSFNRVTGQIEMESTNISIDIISKR